MSDYYAYDAGLPCRNPHCRSHGKPHPNCKCYSGAGTENYAHGGEINFCASGTSHKPECEYFQDGGSVHPAIQSGPENINPSAAQPAHPSITLGHAAVEHGILGLLKNIGRSKMSDPDKHHKVLDKTKAHLSANDHEKSAEALHGHPMSGSVSKNNLKKIMAAIGPAVASQSSDPSSLRSSIDYMNSAIKGHDSLQNHMGKVIGNEKLSIDTDHKSNEVLKEYLENVKENPEQLLDVGGDLGHYLPEHAAGLGAIAATATQYLNSIKPMPMQGGPLDGIVAPDKYSMDQWNRHLDIAQKPLKILEFVKSGTLLPPDLLTLQTLYPGLHQSMVEKAGESLIEAKTNKKEIPYKQRQSLSMLLGQPLDSTMSPESMQAIIKSAGPQQAQNQQNKEKKSSNKVSATEFKAIEKVDSLYETPNESRQINRNK